MSRRQKRRLDAIEARKAKLEAALGSPLSLRNKGTSAFCTRATTGAGAGAGAASGTCDLHGAAALAGETEAARGAAICLARSACR